MSDQFPHGKNLVYQKKVTQWQNHQKNHEISPKNREVSVHIQNQKQVFFSLHRHYQLKPFVLLMNSLFQKKVELDFFLDQKIDHLLLILYYSVIHFLDLKGVFSDTEVLMLMYPNQSEFRVIRYFSQKEDSFLRGIYP